MQLFTLSNAVLIITKKNIVVKNSVGRGTVYSLNFLATGRNTKMTAEVAF